MSTSMLEIIEHFEIDKEKLDICYFRDYSNSNIRYIIRVLFTGFSPLFDILKYEEYLPSLFEKYDESSMCVLDTYIDRKILSQSFFDKYNKYFYLINTSFIKYEKLDKEIVKLLINNGYYNKDEYSIIKLSIIMISRNIQDVFDTILSSSSNLTHKTMSILLEYSLIFGRVSVVSRLLEYDIYHNPFKLSNINNSYIEIYEYNKTFQSINYEICFSMIENKGFNFKKKYMHSWFNICRQNRGGYSFPTMGFILNYIFKVKPTIKSFVNTMEKYVGNKKCLMYLVNYYYSCDEIISSLL